MTVPGRFLASFAFVAAWASSTPAQAAPTCTVGGLDPQRGAVLAVRDGPGARHAQVGVLREGDRVALLGDCLGPWCYADRVLRGDATVPVRGWIHADWCQGDPS